MIKQFVFAIGGCLWLSIGVSQVATIENVLLQIEQNNKTLETLTHSIETQRLKLKTANNLPDPQVGAYYLPIGTHSSGDYTEIQVSQTVEFPTVYVKRKTLLMEVLAKHELAYNAKRLNILSEAKSHCLQLIYVNKRLQTEKNRTEQAKMVYDQVQELFNKEQVGILELNKAKLAWLQDQFNLQQMEGEKQNLLTELISLNGGQPIAFELMEYGETLELNHLDSLWQEKLQKDPSLLQLKKDEDIASRQINLAKSQSLPDLTLGYNSQGVLGERYSGIYGGLSIPLWSNKNTVKAAQANLEFLESKTTSSQLEAYSSFEKNYNKYRVQRTQLKEYQKTLDGLNSEKLLLQSYELGEISFLEYYMELQFYRQAYDAMLDMQYQLYLLKNKILNYKL